MFWQKIMTTIYQSPILLLYQSPDFLLHEIKLVKHQLRFCLLTKLNEMNHQIESIQSQ
jgi:hypothetical protein